jgi:hypothetical protein
MTKWYVGDVAIDPNGTRWKVIAVNDSNLLPYPELGVELIGPSTLPAFRDVMSSRRFKKESTAMKAKERKKTRSE